MKYNINKKILGSLLGVTLLVTSCNDYVDINTSPNGPDVTQLKPNNLFGGAISETYRVQDRDMIKLGAFFTNYTATNSALYGNGNEAEMTLALTPSFYPAIWNSTYRGVANLQKIINEGAGDAKYTYYVGMSYIMKVFYMEPVIDLYGNAPYSDAFQLEANLTPKYDKDTDIYRTMFDELDKGIVFLSATSNVSTVLPSAKDDFVFQGNRDNWKKFANTIRLRMIMRMSNVTGDMATLRNQQIQKLAGQSIMDADVLINPGYSTANNDSQNPFANYYYGDAAGNTGTNWDMDTASAHIATCLNSNDKNDPNPFYQKFNGIADDRAERIFTLSEETGKIVGVGQGVRPGEPEMPSERPLANIGDGWFVGAGAFSITKASSRAGALMTRAEINFLKAEAALKFPALGYDGKSSFENGIKASYAYLGASNPDAYIAQISSVAKLGWMGNDVDKTEAIMTQKWLALGMVAPIQVFFDYNRTGFPYIPLSKTALQSRKPYRLMYPISEVTSNANNVPKMTAADAFAKNDFTPFWLK